MTTSAVPTGTLSSGRSAHPGDRPIRRSVISILALALVGAAIGAYAAGSRSAPQSEVALYAVVGEAGGGLLGVLLAAFRSRRARKRAKRAETVERSVEVLPPGEPVDAQPMAASSVLVAHVTPPAAERVTQPSITTTAGAAAPQPEVLGEPLAQAPPAPGASVAEPPAQASPVSVASAAAAPAPIDALTTLRAQLGVDLPVLARISRASAVEGFADVLHQLHAPATAPRVVLCTSVEPGGTGELAAGLATAESFERQISILQARTDQAVVSSQLELLVARRGLRDLAREADLVVVDAPHLHDPLTQLLLSSVDVVLLESAQPAHPEELVAAVRQVLPSRFFRRSRSTGLVLIRD